MCLKICNNELKKIFYTYGQSSTSKYCSVMSFKKNASTTFENRIGHIEEFNFASTINNLFISLEYKWINTLSLIKSCITMRKKENKN